MISRIFHPIGQGAFYSERHEGFNVVYDCGNWGNSRLADKVVKQSFNTSDTIDILFISHFDYDHVSRIKTLKDHVKRIKLVVLPLLHDEEKILLTNFYRIIDASLLPLIENPSTYFGNETIILSVASSDHDLTPNDNGINLDEISSSMVASGSQLFTSISNYKWVFIPYNHLYKKRNSSLEKKLIAAGFNINKLRSDPNYSITQIVNSKTRKAIRDIYHSLCGKINQNSMVLYSGNVDDMEVTIDWFPPHQHDYQCLCFPFKYSERIGCIYTGDADLNKIDLKDKFSKYWNNVGTIQIPHHGDIKSFNSDAFDKPWLVCPVSFGSNNTYGHPSYAVLSKLHKKNCHVVLVTEKLDSGAIQLIEIY